ncbi:hypothetical protein [Streptomyces sp. NPDC002851]
MAKQPVRVAAAARAAAKRAERARERPEDLGTAEKADTTSAAEPEPESELGSEPGSASEPEPEPGSESASESNSEPESESESTQESSPESESKSSPESEGDTPPGTRSSRLPRASVAALATLALLTVAGGITTTVLGLQYQETSRTNEARTEAVAAARKAAPEILSYDHRHLDRDFATARGHLTGSFLDEYKKTTKTVVEPTAKKYKGVVKATVAKPTGDNATPAVSVVSATPDKAVVLLFMNQVTKSTQISGPRVDLNRVRMTLVQTDQGWKVSAVDAL